MSETESLQVASTTCLMCESPYGKEWSTPDGKALLCPTCATLNGIGCP
jgi:hypothetical protein